MTSEDLRLEKLLKERKQIENRIKQIQAEKKFKSENSIRGERSYLG